MTWLDLLIFVALGWFTYAAYRAGILREFVTLSAIILAIPIAGLFYQRLADRLSAIFGGSTAEHVAAFLMLFVAVIIAGYLASIALKHGVQLLHLGWADRSAGAFFGFLKGLLIVEALLFLLVTYPEPDIRETVDRSKVASFLLEDIPLAKVLLPSEFEHGLDNLDSSDQAQLSVSDTSH